MPPPERPYIKIETRLRSIGEYFKFCGIFTPERTLADIFSEIWERKDLNDLLTLPKLNNKLNLKGRNESERFRIKGNLLYSEKNFEKSLEVYNLAVIAAPHPKRLKERVSLREPFEALSFAYANRSALLFEMGMYNESIEDVDRAIKAGYPASKLYKLEERRGKCLLRMNKKREAEANFKSLLENVLKSQEDNSQHIESLEELIRQCNIRESLKETSMSVWFKHLFHRGPEYPMFSKKVKDESLNFANSAIKVQSSSSKGRYLVATRNIEPGEILLIEKAFCSIVKFNGKIRSYCCFCLRKAPIVVPCDTCSLVVFCSEECSSSPHNHHKLECSMLPVLVEVNPDEELGLVFRTLLKFSFEEIEQERRKVNETCQSTKSRETVDNKDMKSLLQFKYKYSNLRELEGNIDKRSGDCFLEAAANAVVGVKLLQTVPTFWMKSKGGSYEQTNENLIELGAEIMRLLLNFQCNIHCVKELLIDPSVNILSANSYDCGYGVYSAFSMMNHSCAPNALHSNWGDTKFMYSIDFIPKGQEIFDSYGERYVSHEKSKRAMNLKDGYYFDCSCKACNGEWPVFEKLPKAFNLKCVNCTNSLNSSFFCEECKVSYAKQTSKDGKEKNKNGLSIYDAGEVEKSIKNAWNNYETVLKDLNQYKISLASVRKIAKYITLMSKYTVLPHAPIVEAQEALLRCFDLMGSFTFTEALCPK